MTANLPDIIRTSKVHFIGSELKGPLVEKTIRQAKHMDGVFLNQDALQHIKPETLLYSVDFYRPTEQGTEGGLFFGVTHIQSGNVGGEYFMTKGHFHEQSNRAEFYWGISGSGMLVLKSSAGDCWVEAVSPGSLHYIPGLTAHRLVNTGDEILDVGACWPSDSGHDYGNILTTGFGVRLMKGEDGPQVVEA